MKKIKLLQSEKNIFDIYFAAVAGIQFHPRANMDPSSQLPLEQCAVIALRMIDIRRMILEEAEQND